jgi:thiol-disulfide isomerase/thioredoxin
MLKLLSIIGFIIIAGTVRSQSVNIAATSASSVDQLCPNFVFDTLLNYKKGKLAMADWKGKPVIIDFWATFCLPCITDIPKLESFKKRFGDSLQVLLVVTDGIEKAAQFYETRKKANKPLELPCAASTKAHDYFQVRTVSTYVWIDDKGYVKAVTDYSQLTEKNVADFVSKKDIRLKQVETTAWADYKRYLVTIANEMDSNNVLYNSSLTKYLKGVKGAYKYPPKGVGTVIHATNAQLFGLYKIAFGDSTGALPFGRIVIESAHPEKILSPKEVDYAAWQLDNTYCYELKVPKEKQADILKIMQEDLKRLFGYNAYEEYRTQKCWVLTADKNAPVQADSSATPKMVYNGAGCSAINCPFAELFDMIHHYNQEKIILDETGITGNVDVRLQVQMNDMDALKEALKQYGLHLESKDRSIKMLVIKDPSK